MRDTEKIRELENQVSELKSRVVLLKHKAAGKKRTERMTFLDCVKCEYPKCDAVSECTYSVT